MWFLFVRPEICLHLPSDSTSQWTPLVFGYDLPATGRSRDFHPLECAHAGRTYKKHPLDTACIKEIQFRLTQNTYDTRRYRLGERPGEYKKHDYVTGKEVSELKDIPDEKVLTAVAYFHVRFENIHPFADGNSRTGRLLMNYLFVMHDHPPVVIHEEDRRIYFEALEAWDTNQELEPMVRFIQQQTVKTWQKQIDRYVKKSGTE